ncbi:TIGR01244 family protein [Roseovarius pacificus]|uniref:TIGR01244 family protein n=1 Tax=Roseovarius pacificus TaxID=337701 RepID=A0A1M7I1R4_9RHOB|nr:TIGR01244 family sulfur transferase [Roseovarius pacificus]MDW3118207.1 TIGR01244 family sulfur transferase [Roseovarius pacificus]GGO60860.1 oxidoreductase [Roseovarius pacificus]SHM34712.1 TIGR01244 family protein [Roseovarius pacificus]
MDIRRITEDYAVSPQISPDDIPEIKAAGFRSIMCNRPDGEDYGQPEFDAVAEAARAEGIEVRCVPIVSGMVTPQAAQDFAAALEDMPKPMLAYCRSGTRCTMLWSIASYGRLSGDEIVSAARDAGYDMSGLVRQLDRG